MKLKFYLILLLILTLFVACNRETKIQKELKLLTQKSLLEDSSFISFPKEISIYKKMYYIPDSDNYRILVLDSNLNLVKSIGSSGKGPGEFTAVTNIFILNDSIYAYDPNKNRIIVFYIDGSFIREIMPEYANYLTKFCVIGDKIYTCFPYSEKPIIVMDLNGKFIRSFGKLSNKSGNVEKFTNNRWDVLTNGKNIITINLNDPMIDIYNLNGTLLKRIDLTDNKAFLSEYEYKENFFKKNPEKKRNTTIRILKDTYLDGDNIFLLYHEKINGETFAKKFLIYNYKNNTISESINFVSEEGKELDYISSFGVKNDTILVFDMTTEKLVKYKINQR